MLWSHPIFKEFPSLAIEVFPSLAVEEYYVICVCLLIVQVDKGSCARA